MGGPQIPLRIAGPADRDLLVGLIAGFRDFFNATRPSEQAIAAALERLLLDDGTEFLLAGEPAGGFVQLRFRLSLWNESGSEDVWLEDLFVKETERGSGLGRVLMEGAIARARARGAARIQLDANRNNCPALALYERLGFVPSHNPGKWGEGEDLFYTLNLG